MTSGMTKAQINCLDLEALINSGKLSEEDIAARELLEEAEVEFISKQRPVNPQTEGVKAERNVETEIQRIAEEENLLKLKMMAGEREPEEKEREKAREIARHNEKTKNQTGKNTEENKPANVYTANRTKPNSLDVFKPYIYEDMLAAIKGIMGAKEERETEGAMNLEDLFLQEEDSHDGTQDEKSREILREEERQTSRQKVKESMDLEGIENSVFEVRQEDQPKCGSMFCNVRSKNFCGHEMCRTHARCAVT
ncbi:uncharacterized protein [Palaemon carinicauda]|uniref:uncharacterized protein n=1 Tax=Palaemon carinicauda TaxID=392227 RepID=UPI0035B57BC6